MQEPWKSPKSQKGAVDNTYFIVKIFHLMPPSSGGALALEGSHAVD